MADSDAKAVHRHHAFAHTIPYAAANQHILANIDRDDVESD